MSSSVEFVFVKQSDNEEYAYLARSEFRLRYLFVNLSNDCAEIHFRKIIHRLLIHRGGYQCVCLRADRPKSHAMSMWCHSYDMHLGIFSSIFGREFYLWISKEFFGLKTVTTLIFCIIIGRILSKNVIIGKIFIFSDFELTKPRGVGSNRLQKEAQERIEVGN